MSDRGRDDPGGGAGPITDRTRRVAPREDTWDDGGGEVSWDDAAWDDGDGDDWDDDPRGAWDGDDGDDDWDDDDDRDYVVLRPQSGKLRRFGLILLGLVVILGIIVGAVALWVRNRIDPPGDPGTEVAVEVPDGATTADIAEILEREGVISDSTLFGYYVRWKSAGPFQAGEYTLQENLAMGDAIAVLEEGPAPEEVRTITVPEGLIIPEIVQAIAEADPELSAEALNTAIISGSIRSAYQPIEVTSLEGLLFPDTYEVAEDDDAAAIVTRMVKQLDAVAAELGIDQKAPPLGLTAYQALIVASLIEEEARVPEERPMIARVIYNRLAEGIPLGIDATSAYEAVLAGRQRTDLDFESESPYNTRIHAGLPPTPIAAPGRASIEAALNPAEGPWIYYVLQDEAGHHFFTDSAAEFEQAKQRCAELGLGC